MFQLAGSFKPCFPSNRSTPVSVLAWGSSCQSHQHQSPQYTSVIQGCSDGLLSGGDAYLVWLWELANTVISGGGGVEGDRALWVGACMC